MDLLRNEFTKLKSMTSDQKKKLQYIQEEIDLATYYQQSRINMGLREKDGVKKMSDRAKNSIVREEPKSHLYYMDKIKPQKQFSNELDYFAQTRKFFKYHQGLAAKRCAYILSTLSELPKEYVLPSPIVSQLTFQKDEELKVRDYSYTDEHLLSYETCHGLPCDRI